MASNPSQGYQLVDLSDCKKLLQSIAGRIETIEADHKKQNISELEKIDTLHDVISKLCTVEDFFQLLGDPSFPLHKLTPNGLCLIMSECISDLKKIGGINDHQE